MTEYIVTGFLIGTVTYLMGYVSYAAKKAPWSITHRGYVQSMIRKGGQ